MSAEGHLPRGFGDCEPVMRFEPLARGVQKRHEGDRRIEDRRGESCQLFERRFWLAVEHVVVEERGEPL